MSLLDDFLAGSSLDATAPPPSVRLPVTTNLGDIAARVAAGANTYYGTIASVNNAKYAAALAKAQAKGAVAAAKGAAYNDAATARVGLPSPTVLLLVGAGLVSLFLLKPAPAPAGRR